jgi:hypothetical protein
MLEKKEADKIHLESLKVSTIKQRNSHRYGRINSYVVTASLIRGSEEHRRSEIEKDARGIDEN